MEALSSIFLLSKCNYTVKGSPQTATKLQCLWSDMTGLDINEDLISLGVDLCWWNFRACRIFRYKSTRYIYRHLNLYLHIYIYRMHVHTLSDTQTRLSLTLLHLFSLRSSPSISGIFPVEHLASTASSHQWKYSCEVFQCYLPRYLQTWNIIRTFNDNYSTWLYLICLHYSDLEWFGRFWKIIYW